MQKINLIKYKEKPHHDDAHVACRIVVSFSDVRACVDWYNEGFKQSWINLDPKADELRAKLKLIVDGKLSTKDKPYRGYFRVDELAGGLGPFPVEHLDEIEAVLLEHYNAIKAP